MKPRFFLLASLGLIFNSTIFGQSAIFDIPLDPNQQSVASQWVSEALFAVSDPGGQSLGPTAASRAYGLLGTTMYDAWSAFEDLPASTVLGDSLQQSAASNTTANKNEAISYAAYTVLSDIFTDSGIQQSFDSRMTSLGYNPADASSAAANVGVTMGNALIASRANDGSNQANGYADTTGYAPTNSSSNVVDITRWTPENVPIDDPAGPVQGALHPHWGGVRMFGTGQATDFLPPAPQPFLLDSNATANLSARTITRADGITVPISRGLIGTDINPGFIQQAEEVVAFSANLGQTGGDEQKLIAEFWEDPSGTPYPPGTWMFFGQKIGESANPNLDEDVKLFFGAGNAVMDAGIATWQAKYDYDYARPVRAIRELGALGLIGEENAQGEFEIEAYTGPENGTQTILATEFDTYQTPDGNVSPPFPEYTSGHSAFSAAAASLFGLMTGSEDFVLSDGTTGLSVTFEPGDSRFEPGITPDSELTLTWNTFAEAADEAGLSRLYGGIHFIEGDLFGRDLGDEIGVSVHERVQFFLNGGTAVIPEPSSTTLLLIASTSILTVRRRNFA